MKAKYFHVHAYVYNVQTLCDRDKDFVWIGASTFIIIKRKK